MTTPHLHAKLADLMSELHTSPQASFGVLRDALGRRRVMLLPSVKHHHEVTLPAPSHRSPQEQGQELARATVVIELTLLDAESSEQLVTRWIGQATDAPGLAMERAITHAIHDFLQKTFLFLEPTASEKTTSREVISATSQHTLSPESPESPVAAVRRSPQGAHADAPRATPTAATITPVVEEPAVAPAPPAARAPQQLDLLPTPTAAAEPQRANAEEAANEAVAATPEPLPPLTESWKAANALWRALVSEVASSEVMDAFEDALERQHEVDSWRRLSPEQIRVVCHHLRKRSALAPDIRKLSDREEYILSQLSLIPQGSSLNRLEEELRRLLDAALPTAQRDAFIALYLSRMNADSMSEVPGRAAIALCRKLRRLHDEDRERFVLQALDTSPTAVTPRDTEAA